MKAIKTYPWLLALAYLVALTFVIGAASNQALPPFPAIYQGKVTVAGAPAPDGTKILAQIQEFKTATVLTKDGRYSNLVVGPTDTKFLDKQITFHIQGDISTEQAKETDTFIRYNNPAVKTLDLSFAKLPPKPTPIPPFVGDERVSMLPRLALVMALVALATGAVLMRMGARQGRRRA